MPRKSAYPFAALEVGQAFDIPIVRNTAAINSLCYYHGKKLNRQFTWRIVHEENVYEVSRVPGPFSPSYTMPRTSDAVQIKDARA